MSARWTAVWGLSTVLCAASVHAQEAVPRPAQPAAPPAEPAAEITLPELLEFVEAPYPAAALKAGVAGDVLLGLDIDREGKVQRVEVLESAGYGFDEAARDAALRFRFKPATRAGETIAVRIPYRYRFTLAQVERPAQTALTVGNLGGSVRDAGSDAPLTGARVTVKGPDGKAYSATSDAQGNWKLEGLPPGTYSVSIVADGFSGIEGSETVAAGEETLTVYRLATQAPADEDAIEVTVHGERPPRETTRRTIERREMERIPGTGGDALRSIENFPGVARPPGLAGLLIVRGSAPQDTVTFVDGSDIPLIYHFGGVSTVVPTELLDRIDFYPGNFSARYGRVMGGIVDVALRSPTTECYADYGKPTDREGCFHGLAQVDIIDARAFVRGPIGKSWTFAVGGRRSWADVWLGPVLEEAGAGVTSAPVYYDYQLIADTEPSPRSKLSLRFFGSDDRFEFLIRDPAAQDPGIFGGNFFFATRFYRAQAVYRDELSREVELSTMLSAGQNRLEISLGQLRAHVDVYPVDLRTEFALKVAKGVKVNIGQDFQVVPFDVAFRFPPLPRPGEPSPGPFTTRRVLESEQSGTAFRPAWYAEAEVRPTERFLIVPGFRVDYARDSGHSDYSPRLTARYDLRGGPASAEGEAEPELRTTIKGGVGLFHQPPQFDETDEVFGTPGVESNRAIHYSLGAEQELNRRIELSVEGYYKDLDNLVSREPDATGGFTYNNRGSGYVIGLETLLKYNPDGRFFGWAAYTVSRSVRQDRPEDEARLFEFDQTHNLTILGTYFIGRNWDVGAKFRIISGSLTTPVAQPPSLPALYAADAGTYTPIEGAPFSERLPLFHQLDVRIAKAWQYRDWRLTAYLDVRNVYNHAAREAVIYNFDFTQRTYQTGLPILPVFGIKGEF